MAGTGVRDHGGVLSQMIMKGSRACRSILPGPCRPGETGPPSCRTPVADLRAYLQRYPTRVRVAAGGIPCRGLLPSAPAIVSGATTTEITEWGQRATSTVLQASASAAICPDAAAPRPRRRSPGSCNASTAMRWIRDRRLPGRPARATTGVVATGSAVAAGDRGGRQSIVRLRAPAAAPPAPAVRRHPRPHRHPGPGEVGAKTNETTHSVRCWNHST